MNRGIYFIGGASASGKSFCTGELKQKFGVKNIELDDLYNVIKPAVSDDSVAKNITKDVVLFCVKKFLEASVTGILEGGWINPSVAFEISNISGSQFQAVYCGYPNADVELRLETIISHGKHWLTRKDRATAIEWLNNQTAASRWYEDECKKYGIPFFDFSDVMAGSSQLHDHYSAWHTRSLSPA